MTLTPMQLALWANQVQRDCLLEAGDNVELGLAAAEYIIRTQQPVDVPTASTTAPKADQKEGGE